MYRPMMWVSAVTLTVVAISPDMGLVAPVGASILQQPATIPKPLPRPDVQIPTGFDIDLWAEHPLVLDPVAICFDAQNRLYVAETQRQERGVEDNRSSDYWLLDDLASRTIDDRLAYMKKWAHLREGGLDFYTRFADDVIQLHDDDGDGRPDARRHFAGPFDDVLDGTGAGLLEVDGDIWYTIIPKLWRLRDQDDDGVAEIQTVLHDGFGVRFALRGHDLHGLAKGPDGRIYWSVGDRGYHVTQTDGSVLADPHSGAVFRCEPDGSDLEVFYTGLRNPQELAFDQYGRLFTCDNNSDSEDRARVVYVMEGGQTGWDMAYQTLDGDNDRGPWVQEGLWKTAHEGRPAWALPPLSYIGSGPSGLTFLSGVGVPDEYKNHFLMCDFLGSPQHSSVLTFAVQPKGAGFEVVDLHPMIQGVLCTDVEVGWDGAIYISDWVQGWGSTETGRIWRVAHADANPPDMAQEIQRIAAQDWSACDTPTLIALLKHADARLRQRAHWTLADRGSSVIALLAEVVADDESIPRLHALWALGIIDRREGGNDEALKPIRDVLWDEDPVIRASAARLLGDARDQIAIDDLRQLVFDEDLAVAAEAIMSLGKLQDVDSIDAIAEVLWSVPEDPFLRHACVFALAEIGNRERLMELLGDTMPDVRLGALLALRRMGDPAVALALHDPEPFVAAEAARAIHDAEIESAMPALADIAMGLQVPETREGRSLGRRAVEAAVRRGSPVDAHALALIAAEASNAFIVRLEAVRALRDWAEPGPRDRVTGRYRKVSARDSAAAGKTVSAVLPRLATEPDQLGEVSRAAAKALGVSMEPSGLLKVLTDATEPVRTRVDCVQYLVEEGSLRNEALQAALSSGESHLIATAAQYDIPGLSRSALARDLLDSDDPVLQRAAFRVLAEVAGPSSLADLEELTTEATRLDYLEAQNPGVLTDAKWTAAEVGGDPERGSWLVQHHASAACIRCHIVAGKGGIAGPSLEDVGIRLTSFELLESMLDPQAAVTEGYGPMSAMPSMRETLTPHEVRDIVAYLQTCQETQP